MSGLTAAGLYVAVVLAGPHAPHGRMLYDGLVRQPPYRWVRPPGGEGDNEPPKPYTGMLPLTASGSTAAEFDTDDLQAAVPLPKDAVAPRPGETAARITLTPLDPATLAPPPPGRQFDGNAYRIVGVYETSGAPLALRSPITVVLRYAVHATTILKLEKNAKNAPTWVRVPTQVFTGSQEDLAHSDTFGTFVVSSP